MYSVTVRRAFVAQHYLTVPDPGPEGELHSHAFTAEVRLEGPRLNEHGYLADIDAVSGTLESLVERYRDTTLNDRPEFEGVNPSVERFSRVLCERFRDECDFDAPERVAVRLREDDDAWAGYETAL